MVLPAVEHHSTGPWGSTIHDLFIPLRFARLIAHLNKPYRKNRGQTRNQKADQDGSPTRLLFAPCHLYCHVLLRPHVRCPATLVGTGTVDCPMACRPSASETADCTGAKATACVVRIIQPDFGLVTGKPRAAAPATTLGRAGQFGPHSFLGLPLRQIDLQSRRSGATRHNPSKPLNLSLSDCQGSFPLAAPPES